MRYRNPNDRWGAVSQSFHWLMFVLLVVVAVIGLTMGDMPRSPRKIEIYALHKSLGLSILALAALRLAWRAYAGAPREIDGTPLWQSRIARATHVLLYVLLFALPLSGWVLNSAAGYPLQWFGLVNLPHIVARDAQLHELAEELHEAGFYVLLVLVVMHAGAALHHHLFRHDAVLARMLPRRRQRSTENEQ